MSRSPVVARRVLLVVVALLSMREATEAQSPSSDLSVTSITSAPANPVVGTNFTYTIAVTNGGPSQATNVVLTNVLPAGVAFVSGSGPGGACTENCGTVMCPVGSLTGSANVTITATAQPGLIVPPATSATVRDLAAIAGDHYDGALSNNSKYVDTVVYAAPAPVVSSLSKTAGPLGGGTALVITGSNFQAGATVKFGANFATGVSRPDPSHINATSPAGAAGSVPVVVTNPDGQPSNTNVLFTYVPVPTITSIAPNAGPLAANPVQIQGTDLATASSVSFGGVAATPTAATATLVNVTAPARATAGIVSVTVTTVGGTSNSLSYRYALPPTISDFNPKAGPIAGGQTVTLTGTNLLGTTQVKFGGILGGTPTATDTTVTVTTPARGLPASVTVQVVAPGGSATAGSNYQYQGVPAISSINPNFGPQSGGTSVSITGTELLNAVVKFDTTLATTSVNTNTSIQTTAPLHAPGAIALTVTTPGGATSGTYTYIAAPTVTSVAPAFGTQAGGINLVIGGTGFQSGATVKVGGVAATSVTFLSATVLRAVSPGISATGAVDVLVQNPDGQSGTLTGGYLSLCSSPNLTVTAPAYLVPNTTGYTASVSGGGTGLVWSLSGATITAGQGLSTVTFRSGAAGTTVAIQIKGSSGCGVRRAQTDFLDVLPSSNFHDFVDNIAGNGITAGCGGGNYCPDATVTRDTMAVFLLRSKNGFNFLPPPATGNVFGDVPASNPFAAWIEKLAADGVTGGCAAANPPTQPLPLYCPTDPVTRGQMAVFLLRSKYGSTYAPPAATGTVFGDVSTTTMFAAWIEELAREGVTGGCAAANPPTQPLPLYCPTDPVTRAPMAVFLVKNYLLTFP